MTEKKQAIAAASKQLRHQAVQDTYQGRKHPEYAFGLASVLDVLEVGYRELPVDVQDGAVAAAREITRPE